MKNWALNRDGFIMNYMLAGPVETDYETDTRDANQLRLEAKLRAEIVTEKTEEISLNIKMGEASPCGSPWTVYYSHGNCFIDRSKFYSTLTRVRMWAAAELWAPEEMEVRTVLWTYMSVGVYCNGKLAGEQRNPIYKPIHHKELTLSLKKGRNLICLDCENLGVRDTRNIVGLQLMEHRSEIRVQLPDEECQESVWQAQAFLDGLKIEEGRLCSRPEIFAKAGRGNICSAGARSGSEAPAEVQCAEVPTEAQCAENPAEAQCAENPPVEIQVCFPVDSPDYDVMHAPLAWENVSPEAFRGEGLPIPESAVRILIKAETLGKAEAGGALMSRALEITEHHRPQYGPDGITREENFRRITEGIAYVSCLNRGVYGFSISNILARKYLNRVDPADRQRLFDVLKVVEDRVDCSDFQLCGLLRYMHCYGLDEELQERAKQVLLNYRYWMTMEGADAMCFWSENHSLLFYTCAMDAGDLYPDDYFVRAKMTGRELHAYGRRKVLDWLADVEKYGFEEFLSTVYMCITFMALLNLVDFAEKEISVRAAAITDRLFAMLCDQTFKGCVVAPMGRVYREVLYPFSQGAQALMNLVDPTAPYSYGEGWLGALPTSRYRLPDGLVERMRGCAEKIYTSGNAKIVLEKQEDYCLTSVCSPREPEFKRWPNIQKDPSADRDTHEYTKSLNECFHGTTNFGPGVFGYQQHMWYAALDGEAVVFANHPASSSEETGMRPGYWNGNGVMPAIRQEHGRLGAIYDIPDTYPIHFTHLYCPKNRFEETRQEDGWLFMRKGDGYLALWCSEALTPHDDVLFDCELRAYGDTMAYFCVCGSRKTCGNFETFMESARGQEPVYDAESRTLTAADGYRLQYRVCADETQYID